MSTTADAALKGADLIRDEVRRLPDKPGVYRMYGEDGEVLYVGKARSLKKRVVQYAQGRFHTQRIALMVDLTRAMEFVTTRTETDALFLEINLIKQLKPRFNVLLRDDKSFPEIVIRREHAAPQLRKHRGAHTIKGDYFGPFASAWAVNRTLNTLQKAFLLRSCSDSVYESRTRPCMLHQIRRCAAPCTGLVSLDDYRALVEEAEAFLRGKSRAVMGRMAAEMQAASDDMEFERAARLRDRIRALASVAQETQVNPETIEEADVFALHAEGGQACQAFYTRQKTVMAPRRPVVLERLGALEDPGVLADLADRVRLECPERLAGRPDLGHRVHLLARDLFHKPQASMPPLIRRSKAPSALMSSQSFASGACIRVGI